MAICPYCDSPNIEGEENCEQCGLPLSEMHLPMPASSIERRLLKDRVSSLYPKAPSTVAPTATVRDVLAKLVDERIGCVLVVDNHQLVGIFSERDAVLKLNTRVAEYASRPISEFMTPNPQTLAPGAKIAFAVQRMDLGSYRHVPIVNEAGQAAGIISVRDILRYLTERIADAAG
jgi:CBS domain-containing protein